MREGLFKGSELEACDRVFMQRSGVEVTVLGPRDASEGYNDGGWWAQSDDGRSWKLYDEDAYLVVGVDES